MLRHGIDPRFKDDAWRSLDVPHDWAVELPFANVKNDDLMSHGYKAVGGLFPETSIGWYRKLFAVAKSIQDIVSRFSLMEFSEMQIFGSMDFIWGII
jgi:hypothetical protein